MSFSRISNTFKNFPSYVGVLLLLKMQSNRFVEHLKVYDALYTSNISSCCYVKIKFVLKKRA